jgi:hypothetical protein
MFQWQTIGKKNWAALPPKKCAFQTPTADVLNKAVKNMFPD